jgi:predicted lipid-binding transport protein (Tim44 family)
VSPRTRSGVVLGGSPMAAPATAPPPPAGPARTRSPLAGGLAGGLSQLGARGYLYLLVILELAAIAGLRRMFRDSHGG